MDGCGEHEVETVDLEFRPWVTNSDHRQSAWRAGGTEPASKHQGLMPTTLQINDHGFDREIAERGNGGIGPTRGHRAPSQAVQTLRQGASHGIVARNDQNSRLDACGHSRCLPSTAWRYRTERA